MSKKSKIDYGLLLSKHITTVHSATKLKSKSYLGMLYPWILEQEISALRAGHKALSVEVSTSDKIVRVMLTDNNLDSVVCILERRMNPKNIRKFEIANQKVKSL